MSESILFPAGSTCEVYSFGYTFGCTNESGITREVDHQWFFDGTNQAWVSVSDEKPKNHSNLDSTVDNQPVGGGPSVSLSTPSTFKVSYTNSVVYIGAKFITLSDPPPPGIYAEKKIIVDGSPDGARTGSGQLTFRGLTYGQTSTATTSVIKLDPDINLSGTTFEKRYSFTAFTEDGGQNYYIYSNGSTFGWDI